MEGNIQDLAIACGRYRIEHRRLTGSVIRDVCLGEAEFDDVNLGGATFSNINLKGVAFDDVNMSNVEITHANLTGMRINGHLVTDLLRSVG